MTAKNENQDNVLHLDGEMTVNRAADLKDLLLEALDGSDSVEIDVDRVTKVDLACLQLFCAAHKAALRDGKRLHVRNMKDSILRTAGEAAGFITGAECRFYPEVHCLRDGG